MGYTHYYYQHQDCPSKTWGLIQYNYSVLLDAASKIIPIEDYSTKYEISFNGLFEYSHEDFVLTRYKRDKYNYESEKEYKEKGALSFCKTAHKPYDLLVCSLLIVTEFIAPETYTVESDGTAMDWDGAFDFVKAVLPQDSIYRAGTSKPYASLTLPKTFRK